jgi:uncharacterized protein (DUF433 family)
VATVLFGEDFQLMRARADALLIPAQFQPFVAIDPAVRSGFPIVRGTTIETSLLHRLREQGLPYRRIHDYYPVLSHPQIKAAVRFEGFLDAEAA